MASLRQKKVDPTQPLPILHYTDTALLAGGETHRSVPTLGTGIEQDEEMESHLRDAIASGATIPTRDVHLVQDLYNIRSTWKGHTIPNRRYKPYLRWHAPSSGDRWRPAEEIEYDADESDATWLQKFLEEHPGAELDLDRLEQLINAMETECRGAQTISLEHIYLEGSQEVLDAVYDYWADKRKKRPLFARYCGVPTREDTRWWVPFRPRDKNIMEKKRRQLRNSYLGLKHLQADLNVLRVSLNCMKKRERIKYDLVDLVGEHIDIRAELAETGQITTSLPSIGYKKRKTWVPRKIAESESDESEVSMPDIVPVVPKYKRERGLRYRIKHRHAPTTATVPYDDMVPRGIFTVIVERGGSHRRRAVFGLRGRIGRGGRRIIDRPRVPMSSAVRYCVPLPWKTTLHIESESHDPPPLPDGLFE